MPTALVTGASRGVGRGVAIALADAGYEVYATGRSITGAELPPEIHRMVCDHTDDTQVAVAFDRVGSIDVLVNSAWGGYERMMENGQFTWSVPFWEQPLHRWESMMDAGVRAAFVASQHAARKMIAAKAGLIVNISFWPAQKYVGNVIYGIAKAATDKLTADTAHELGAHGVSVVSLYPGMVRTEAVMAAAEWLDLSNSESPEFIGRVIAALAADAKLPERSGQALIAAALALEYGITDIDGKQPRPLTLADV
jgi:dehydrogenase/reductase SDR family protein 1